MGEKYRFAFIMLNYNSMDKTIVCVKSILDRINNPLIVIVDNASADGSGIKLSEHYANNQQVKVVLNKSNIGFSRGLNIGYRIAKKLKYDFIALINNDTELLTDRFCDICIEDYLKYGYAVLGPRIKNSDIDSGNNNPYHIAEKNTDEMITEVEAYLKKASKQLILAKIGLREIYIRIIYLLLKIFPLKNNSQSQNEKECFEIELNCGLHGSYLVFSPKYVVPFDGLEEITFAYYEEWLLYMRCQRNDLLTIYEPRIVIWHDEHTTQNRNSKNENKRYVFRAQLQIDAAKNILSYAREIKKEEQKEPISK